MHQQQKCLVFWKRIQTDYKQRKFQLPKNFQSSEKNSSVWSDEESLSWDADQAQ